MVTPGRSYSAGSGYRYGFNGQEKNSDVNNNNTTALFWEYDSRIGRRWNVDPKPVTYFSPYNCFAGNPVSFSDPNGDTTVIRNSKGEVLGTHWGKTGNYVLILDSKNDQKWTDLKNTNFKDLNAKKLTDQQFLNLALTQGKVFDINSAKGFYTSWVGKGSVDKIFGTPINMMKDIVINGKKASVASLKELIKREKLGPEWEGSWQANQQGILQIEGPRTDHDLTEVFPGLNIAHLHPNTSTTYIITFSFKLANGGAGRTGYAELKSKSPVDGHDMYIAERYSQLFGNSWNTVLEKNRMWFYDGNYNRFKMDY